MTGAPRTYDLYPWLSAFRPETIPHPTRQRKLSPEEFQDRYSSVSAEPTEPVTRLPY